MQGICQILFIRITTDNKKMTNRRSIEIRSPIIFHTLQHDLQN